MGTALLDLGRLIVFSSIVSIHSLIDRQQCTICAQVRFVLEFRQLCRPEANHVRPTTAWIAAKSLRCSQPSNGAKQTCQMICSEAPEMLRTPTHTLRTTRTQKNFDKQGNIKELTTQFSVSKKRDTSTRSEIGMFTAAKFWEFSGARFKDFATTEETSAAVECLVEQTPKSLHPTRRLRTAPLHSWSSTATRTHRASSSATAHLTIGMDVQNSEVPSCAVQRLRRQ